MEAIPTRVLSEEEAEKATPKVRVQMSVNVNKADRNGRSLKRVWDNYKVIGEVKKTPKKKLVIAAAIRDGVKSIYIREFYLHRDLNEWVPNPRQGITIPVIYPLYDFSINKLVDTIMPFAEAVELMYEAVDALEDMYLYDDEHAVYVERKKKKGQTDESNNI